MQGHTRQSRHQTKSLAINNIHFQKIHIEGARCASCLFLPWVGTLSIASMPHLALTQVEIQVPFVFFVLSSFQFNSSHQSNERTANIDIQRKHSFILQQQ